MTQDSTTTAPADAREKLIAVLRDVAMSDEDRLADWFVALTEDAGETDLRLLADAILAAFPQIAAPTQSAVETARRLLDSIAERMIATIADESCVAEIAAAITAAEARVREECAKIAGAAAADWDIARSSPKSIAAAIRAGGGR